MNSVHVSLNRSGFEPPPPPQVLLLCIWEILFASGFSFALKQVLFLGHILTSMFEMEEVTSCIN